MLNCPICPAQNIADDNEACPRCGADLRPIRRLRESRQLLLATVAGERRARRWGAFICAAAAAFGIGRCVVAGPALHAMSRQIDDLRNAMLQQSTTVGADLAQALLPVRAELVTGRARTDQLATMQAEQGQAQAKILEGWEQVARSVQADAEKLEQLSRHSAASLQEIATALAAFRAEHRREEPAGPTALTQTLDELRAGLRACREETASLSAVAERHRADTLRGFALLLQAHRLPELEELAARRRDLEARLHSLSLEEANRKQRSPDLFDAFKDARRREALKRAQQESDDVDRQYRSRVLPWELTMRRLSEMAAGVRQE